MELNLLQPLDGTGLNLSQPIQWLQSAAACCCNRIGWDGTEPAPTIGWDRFEPVPAYQVAASCNVYLVHWLYIPLLFELKYTHTYKLPTKQHILTTLQLYWTNPYYNCIYYTYIDLNKYSLLTNHTWRSRHQTTSGLKNQPQIGETISHLTEIKMMP